MGRELRMVPPNWNHPKVIRQTGREGYQPMHNGTFAEAAKEWKKEFAAWERGEYPSYADEDSKKLQYWEWNGMPPEREYYQPWEPEEATWFQVWETVSEGTPITPPFATKDELVFWLTNNKDFWDYTWTSKQAESFVYGSGYAPSAIYTTDKGIRPGYVAMAEEDQSK